MLAVTDSNEYKWYERLIPTGLKAMDLDESGDLTDGPGIVTLAK